MITFLICGRSYLLQPLFIIISTMQVWSVKKIRLDLAVENESNALMTPPIKSSKVFGASLYCNYWMLLKKPKSRIFKSGELGGWLIRRMQNPSFMAIWENSMSLGSTWHLALSCWIKIGSPMESLGHFSLIAGKTCSIRYLLLTSLVTEVIGFVTNVPVGLLQHLLFAGSYITIGILSWN